MSCNYCIEYFKSAENNSNWEMGLSGIANDKANKKGFFKGIDNEIKNTIEQYYK